LYLDARSTKDDQKYISNAFWDILGWAGLWVCNIPVKAKRGQQPLATLVKSEIARWTPIIKAANTKVE
jgi:hypothetical protein